MRGTLVAMLVGIASLAAVACGGAGVRWRCPSSARQYGPACTTLSRTVSCPTHLLRGWPLQGVTSRQVV